LPGVDGGRFESETSIEGTRPLVLGVDEKRPDTGDVGRLKGAEAGIPQQAPSDSFALMADIHGPTRQDHYRYRIAHLSLSDPLMCACIIDCACDQSVITDNIASLTNDEGVEHTLFFRLVIL